MQGVTNFALMEKKNAERANSDDQDAYGGLKTLQANYTLNIKSRLKLFVQSHLSAMRSRLISWAY